MLSQSQIISKQFRIWDNYQTNSAFYLQKDRNRSEVLTRARYRPQIITMLYNSHRMILASRIIWPPLWFASENGRHSRCSDVVKRFEAHPAVVHSNLIIRINPVGLVSFVTTHEDHDFLCFSKNKLNDLFRQNDLPPYMSNCEDFNAFGHVKW